jgi:hypothetical protein
MLMSDLTHISSNFPCQIFWEISLDMYEIFRIISFNFAKVFKKHLALLSKISKI